MLQKHKKLKAIKNTTNIKRNFWQGMRERSVDGDDLEEMGYTVYTGKTKYVNKSLVNNFICWFNFNVLCNLTPLHLHLLRLQLREESYAASDEITTPGDQSIPMNNMR